MVCFTCDRTSRFFLHKGFAHVNLVVEWEQDGCSQDDVARPACSHEVDQPSFSTSLEKNRFFEEEMIDFLSAYPYEVGIMSYTLCYTLWGLLKVKRSILDIKEQGEKQRALTNDALFFQASGLSDCEKHIYKKKMCYHVDCPYRKLSYIMDCLESSRKSLDVCIHLLTSMEIATCIISAHKRGVNVRVVCDNEMSTNKGSQVRTISSHGVPVRIPLLNYHMHSKIAIIDGCRVMTGSVNWTVQGMYGNWDNLVVTSQKTIVKDAMDTFNIIWTDPKTQLFS